MQGKNGILALPLSLKHLVEATEYPPKAQAVLHKQTSKVVMIVDSVSPTPFALLRRAKNFHYRDDDEALQRFSDYEDPIHALTDECRRVLKSISSANDSSNSKTSTSLRDTSWSRFEDLGFGGFGEDFDADDMNGSAFAQKRQQPQGLRTTPASKTDLGRPTTPSWADFLSSGFVDESTNGGPTLLLPPDKVLPPINTRGQSSQSHRPSDDGSMLEPGELASITAFNLDETFWWVWITSLAGEEPVERKAAFGRCALIETSIRGGQWLLMEEIIKGAAPEPDAGAYIAEKKSRFGFTKRGKLSRSKSSAKGVLPKADAIGRSNAAISPISNTSIAPDQHARIQAAAAALQQKHQAQEEEEESSARRARMEDDQSKTNSVLTLQPVIMSEAAPAMKWASTYDKNTIRAKYLGDNFAGRGSALDIRSDASSNAQSLKDSAPSPPPKPQSQTPRDPTAGLSKVDPAFLEVLNKGSDQVTSQQRTPRTRVEQPYAKLDQPRSASHSNVALPAVPSKDHGETTRQPPEVSGQANRATEHVPPDGQKDAPGVEQGKAPALTQGLTHFAPGPEYSKQQQSNGAAIASPPSPESPKREPKKIRKKGNAGPLKGLFSRRKENETPKPAPYSPPTNASAVAAARAALEAKAAQNSKSPEPAPAKVTSKRFSTIGRKEVPGMESSDHVKAPQPMPVIQDPRPEPPKEDSYEDSHASVSAIDPNEEQRAEQEFRSFDQGPMEDVPAFVPQESPRNQTPQPENVTPVSEAAASELEIRDDVSEQSEGEEMTRTISPNDRWAQIRKNAAERAAARQSEEQSRQTDRTDEGDTSGEESKI